MDGLDQLRKRIDATDRRLIKLMLVRFSLVKKIGIIKKANKIKISDKGRELVVMGNVKKHSRGKHKKFLTQIFYKVIDYSKKIQRYTIR